jgi:hypothetical protein
MARTVADIRADRKRLETLLRGDTLKRRTPLRHTIRSEVEALKQAEDDRMEARAARRATRHTEIDSNEAALAALREDTSLSPYLRNKLDDWGARLAKKREVIDE